MSSLLRSSSTPSRLMLTRRLLNHSAHCTAFATNNWESQHSLATSPAMPRKKLDASAREEATNRWPFDKHWELVLDGIDLSRFVGPRRGDIDEDAYLKLGSTAYKAYYSK